MDFSRYTRSSCEKTISRWFRSPLPSNEQYRTITTDAPHFLRNSAARGTPKSSSEPPYLYGYFRGARESTRISSASPVEQRSAPSTRASVAQKENNGNRRTKRGSTCSIPERLLGVTLLAMKAATDRDQPADPQILEKKCPTTVARTAPISSRNPGISKGRLGSNTVTAYSRRPSRHPPIITGLGGWWRTCGKSGCEKQVNRKLLEIFSEK